MDVILAAQDGDALYEGYQRRRHVLRECAWPMDNLAAASCVLLPPITIRTRGRDNIQYPIVSNSTITH